MARLVYLGTPAAAVPPLRALVEAGHDVALVVTRADARRGRGSATSPSPVKAAAVELGLPVSHEVGDAVGADAELGVVVAYGRIIRPPVLERLPMVNIHFSLLPRWRGAAPVERAILAGDAETGVTLMALDEGLDTGPMYQSRRVTIGAEETAAELRDRLSELGARMVVDALAHGVDALGTPTPQEGDPTYAAKIEPEDLRLDWTADAAVLHRVVRVGGAWTTADGRRLRVVAAAATDEAGAPGSLAAPTKGRGPVAHAGRGGLELRTVQPEGKQAMDASAWWRGARGTTAVLGR